MEIPEGLTREDLVDQYDHVARLRCAPEIRLGFVYHRLELAFVALEGGRTDRVAELRAQAFLLSLSDEDFSAFEAEVSVERAHNANLTVVGGPFERAS